MFEECLLVIDDEPSVLKAIERVFADRDLRMLTASDPREGLELLRREKVAVLVTDNLMPDITGLELLRHAREASPDTVRIMLTGQADLDTAVAAINVGEVFRFILKPWDDAELIQVVEQAMQRYQVVRGLRSGNEGVMLSMAQAIELKDPYTRGHCDRVATYAGIIGETLGLDEKLRQEIRYGSWLHDCGKIGVSEAILNRPASLSEDEYAIVKRHSLWGAELARLAHLPQTVVNIILHHHERYDGKGYPEGLAGGEIPLEARLVSVADVFDALTSNRPYRAPYSFVEALDTLETVAGTQLDRNLVSVFKDNIAKVQDWVNEGVALGTSTHLHTSYGTAN